MSKTHDMEIKITTDNQDAYQLLEYGYKPCLVKLATKASVSKIRAIRDILVERGRDDRKKEAAKTLIKEYRFAKRRGPVALAAFKREYSDLKNALIQCPRWITDMESGSLSKSKSVINRRSKTWDAGTLVSIYRGLNSGPKDEVNLNTLKIAHDHYMRIRQTYMETRDDDQDYLTVNEGFVILRDLRSTEEERKVTYEVCHCGCAWIHADGCRFTSTCPACLEEARIDKESRKGRRK